MWHIIPHMLVWVPATTTWLSQVWRWLGKKHPWVRPRALPEPEAGSESCEVAAGGLACGCLPKPEEGVALHGALPQVFAGLGAGELEHEGVLLLVTLRSEETARQSPGARVRALLRGRVARHKPCRRPQPRPVWVDSFWSPDGWFWA